MSRPPTSWIKRALDANEDTASGDVVADEDTGLRQLLPHEMHRLHQVPLALFLAAFDIVSIICAEDGE